MVLRTDEMQLSRGESMRDTALVLSRHARRDRRPHRAPGDARGARPHAHDPGLQHADRRSPSLPGARRPADAARGLRRASTGCKLAYVGDGNNVARSLAILGAIAGVEVVVASPEGYQLEPVAGGAADRRPARGGRRGPRRLHRRLGLHERRAEAAAARASALAPYRLDDALLAAAAPGAIALHYLPAHPGEEITDEVLYGERQRIWDQAENRRHAQKALLELLVAPLTLSPVEQSIRHPPAPRRRADADGSTRSRSAAPASRALDGYVVFVDGAIPGDTVRAARRQVASAHTPRRA